MARPKVYSAPVPTRAASDRRLTVIHHRLLEIVAFHDRMGRNGAGCYLTQLQVAAFVGTTQPNVNLALGELIELGYLTAEKSTVDKRRLTYRVCYMDSDNLYGTAYRPPAKVYMPNLPSIEPEQGVKGVQDKEHLKGNISCETEPATNLKNISCETGRLLGNGSEIEGESPTFMEMVERWKKPLAGYWGIRNPTAWITNRVDRLERSETLTQVGALDKLHDLLVEAQAVTGLMISKGEISKWSDFPLDEWLEELEGHEDHD